MLRAKLINESLCDLCWLDPSQIACIHNKCFTIIADHLFLNLNDELVAVLGVRHKLGQLLPAILPHELGINAGQSADQILYRCVSRQI